MKIKKVIRLIVLSATIKPMVSLATYPFQVITNYFSIRKNRVIKEPSGKGYERTRTIAVLAKKKAVENFKLQISNKIQNEATTSDTDCDKNSAEETNISSYESQSDNQDKEEQPYSLPECQIKSYLGDKSTNWED